MAYFHCGLEVKAEAGKGTVCIYVFATFIPFYIDTSDKNIIIKSDCIISNTPNPSSNSTSLSAGAQGGWFYQLIDSMDKKI